MDMIRTNFDVWRWDVFKDAGGRVGVIYERVSLRSMNELECCRFFLVYELSRHGN
jgi:hypothetical protein